MSSCSIGFSTTPPSPTMCWASTRSSRREAGQGGVGQRRRRPAPHPRPGAAGRSRGLGRARSADGGSRSETTRPVGGGIPLRRPSRRGTVTMSNSKPRIRIVLDVHERASGMPAALEALGADIEVASLPAGDYAVGAATLVERKTVLDLHGAILKGRLWPQLGKLRAESDFPYLLVEGRDPDRGPLHPNAIRGACLAAIDQGIALLRTDRPSDSARWLYRLAVRCQRVEEAPDRPAYAQRPKAASGLESAEALLADGPRHLNRLCPGAAPAVWERARRAAGDLRGVPLGARHRARAGAGARVRDPRRSEPGPAQHQGVPGARCRSMSDRRTRTGHVR
jgi:ERCC4-type nuclease